MDPSAGKGNSAISSSTNITNNTARPSPMDQKQTIPHPLPVSSSTSTAASGATPCQNSSQPAMSPSVPTADAFDLSAYDPFQLHMLQLVASAGLSNSTLATQQQVQQQQQHSAIPQNQQSTSVGAPVDPNPMVSQAHKSGAPAVSQMFTQSSATFPTTAVPFQSGVSAFTSPAEASQRPLIDDASSLTQSLRAGVPSIVSASTSASTTGSVTPAPSSEDQQDFNGFRKQLPPDWNAMSAEEKRRFERNMREQQRSHQISQQIKELRSILTESQIPFKPNKFSILLSISEYIKQLQARAIMLDAEHRKLVSTIQNTSEMVNSGQIPELEESEPSDVGNDAEMLFVRDLNYREVFHQCSAALGVAALDGRIIECNTELEAFFRCSRGELLQTSVFNLIQSHEQVFRAMSDMLKAEASAATASDAAESPHFWSGLVSRKDDVRIIMNITLTRTPDGSPKFFNFSLTTA